PPLSLLFPYTTLFRSRVTGGHRVIDALATLAFDYPPRADFFRGELEQFLLLTREQAFDPLQLKGSYAGAMGYGQFIPSSYRNYADRKSTRLNSSHVKI